MSAKKPPVAGTGIDLGQRQISTIFGWSYACDGTKHPGGEPCAERLAMVDTRSEMILSGEMLHLSEIEARFGHGITNKIVPDPRFEPGGIYWKPGPAEEG